MSEGEDYSDNVEDDDLEPEDEDDRWNLWD